MCIIDNIKLFGTRERDGEENEPSIKSLGLMETFEGGLDTKKQAYGKTLTIIQAERENSKWK